MGNRRPRHETASSPKGASRPTWGSAADHGVRPTTDFLTLSVNGAPVTVPAGASVSAAIALAGVTLYRRSVNGEPRAPLCGMGICFECSVTIDGRAHCRSCQVVCQPGMEVRTDA